MTTHTQVLRTYLLLLGLSTTATSLIWGINTLFLLDAGLSNTQAFAANAFFTVGMVLFEVPTGILADSYGRRLSYLLGTVTLAATTIFYYTMWMTEAPFWLWAASSVLLGLGFTFFSGAVEAWLVDAMTAVKSKMPIDDILAKGQIVSGSTMLGGSVLGGIIAQTTSIGVPYILRAVILLVTFVVAAKYMLDVGFTPEPVDKPLRQMRHIFNTSLTYGLKNPPVRWVMLAAPITMGLSFYVFYALQPYLLKLYGDPDAFAIAGLAAAIVAGAQILGGFATPHIRKLFKKRTSILALGLVVNTFVLVIFGVTNSFAIALIAVVLWAVLFSALMPVRQAYINGLIPSRQRATVLSFDSLMGSSGGVVVQPALGKIADVYSYSTSFIVSGCINVLALPFILLAKKERVDSDTIVTPS